MKIALQIILLAFMTLYFGGAIGANSERQRTFDLVAGTLLAVAEMVTIAIL